jgi:hypothetical protein
MELNNGNVGFKTKQFKNKTKDDQGRQEKCLISECLSNLSRLPQDKAPKLMKINKRTPS